MKYYIAVFVVVFCMLSCNRHSVHWETLRQVEACIEAQPDSALAALKRIDAQELAGKDERANIAIHLQYRCNVIAISWYRQHSVSTYNFAEKNTNGNTTYRFS